ncbi:OLC1v1004569C1 [Oldenlandia corymbosa var. corymbosa]|uniref:OLC1v1004569C1 n=1 Tax=Oldenlandia corymbosa var. corymbosa TaxID=529605 RepID=A0AAV1DCK2_OLDCO|nr:OLC1v1004569C1 [Oldenlandia corymbosa var. corymbosa]
MEADLENPFSRLSLDQRESRIVEPEKNATPDYDHEKALVGKLLTNRILGHNTIVQKVRKFWNLKGNLTTSALGDNTLLFCFSNLLDKKGVLAGAPWFVEDHLLILKEDTANVIAQNHQFTHSPLWVQLHGLPVGLMSKSFATTASNNIGWFMEVFCDSEGSCIGRFLQIKVIIDVRQPLMRVTTVNNDGLPLRIKLRYERMSDFYYFCGVIVHEHGKCDLNFASNTSSSGPFEFGPFLTADPFRNPFPEKRSQSSRKERPIPSVPPKTASPTSNHNTAKTFALQGQHPNPPSLNHLQQNPPQTLALHKSVSSNLHILSGTLFPPVDRNLYPTETRIHHSHHSHSLLSQFCLTFVSSQIHSELLQALYRRFECHNNRTYSRVTSSLLAKPKSSLKPPPKKPQKT